MPLDATSATATAMRVAASRCRLQALRQAKRQKGWQARGSSSPSSSPRNVASRERAASVGQRQESEGCRIKDAAEGAAARKCTQEGDRLCCWSCYCSMQQPMHSAKEGEERKKLHLHSRFKGKARQEMAGQKCIQEERTYSGSGGEPDRERVVEEDDDVGGSSREKKGLHAIK